MRHTINHACGHAEEVNLFGRHADRDRKVQWLESRDCQACRLGVANVASAQASTRDGLPPLEGSEKQVAWATTIRQGLVRDARQFVARFAESCRLAGRQEADQLAEMATSESLAGVLAAADLLGDSDLASQNDPAMLRASFTTARHVSDFVSAMSALSVAVQNRRRASWWIDRRGAAIGSLPGLLAEEEAKAEEELAKSLKRDEVEAFREEIRARIGAAMAKWASDWKLEVGTWSGCKRVYFGWGYEKNVAVLHVTGDAKHSPMSLERCTSRLEDTEAEALAAVLTDVASKCNCIEIWGTKK